MLCKNLAALKIERDGLQNACALQHRFCFGTASTNVKKCYVFIVMIRQRKPHHINAAFVALHNVTRDRPARLVVPMEGSPWLQKL
jgi:hypothetical protein